MHTLHADIPNTNTRACLASTPTYFHSSAPCNSIYYALMLAGYVLHSHECLECGVVGKCCSNVLRSLLAYVIVVKAVRTCVCEKSDTAHVCSSRCAIPYIQPSTRSYTPCIRARRHTKYKHACIPCTYTYLHSSAQRSIYHAQTCPTTTHSCEQAMYCTHWSVWSVELWASAAAMCCAPSAPMEFP
jgi:hypothetical protein